MAEISIHMQILDGKHLSETLKGEIAETVSVEINKGKRPPHLAAILVGQNGASQTYVNHKVRACERVGFTSSLLKFDESIAEDDLLKEIDQLNLDEEIDGFIVQLPLPNHISDQKVISRIDYKKDVDGFHPMNVGRLVLGLPSFVSATPAGIMEMLKRYRIETSGKKAVVIGRSNIVGRPISILLSRSLNPGNCTVTLCHSRTKNLTSITQEADILIAALGRPGFVTAEMVKQDAVVIDVGITRVDDATKKNGYRLQGDVNFEEVAPKCSYITPVPGGVGPLTVCSLLLNTLKAYTHEIYPK